MVIKSHIGCAEDREDEEDAGSSGIESNTHFVCFQIYVVSRAWIKIEKLLPMSVL